ALRSRADLSREHGSHSSRVTPCQLECPYVFDDSRPLRTKRKVPLFGVKLSCGFRKALSRLGGRSFGCNPRRPLPTCRNVTSELEKALTAARDERRDAALTALRAVIKMLDTNA